MSLTGSTVYSNDYYPFGSTPSEVTEDNRYLYNGKEDQSFTGLPYIDYGARMYDPATGRWLSQDPLSEKYYGVSPYATALMTRLIILIRTGGMYFRT